MGIKYFETDLSSDNDEFVAFNGFQSSNSSADPDTGDVIVPYDVIVRPPAYLLDNC